MSNTIYPYVKDEDFLKEVKLVLDAVKNSLEVVEDNLHSNVIDPFSAFFDAVTQNLTYSEWVEQEKHRQLQKTLQNAIGYFHQNILGHVKGWNNPGSGGGYDVENKRKKVFAEIKNKHNTFNSSSMDATYEKMVRFLEGEKRGYMGYVVIILPKNNRKYNKLFVPAGKNRREDLRTVDGATFYEMATGDKNALRLLFNSIPKAVKILEKDKKIKTDTKDFIELFDMAYGEE